MAAPDLVPQHIVVPFARGLGQDTDRRLRPPDRLERARNCRSVTSGKLSKRYGFNPITDVVMGASPTQLSTQGPVRALGATDRELVAVAHRQLLAYSLEADVWIDRGHVSPCAGRTREVFRSHALYEAADTGRSTNYIARAAAREEAGQASQVPFKLEYEIVSVADEVLHPRTVLVQDATHAQRSPVCIGLADRIVLLWIDNTTPSLKRAQFRESLLATGFSTMADIESSDLYVDPATNTQARTFHGCAVQTGEYFVAWIKDSTRHIALSLYNAAGAQTQSSSIAGQFSRVAIVDSPTTSQVYVLTVDDTDGQVVELWARRRSDLSAQWGPITLYTTVGNNDGQVVDNLGVCEGETLAGDDRVSCHWKTYSTDDGFAGPNAVTALHNRSTNTTGGSLDTRAQVYNAAPLSQPFWYRHRCYAHAIVQLVGLGFTSSMLVDLGVGDTGRGAGSIKLAAIFDVGLAVTGNVSWNLVGACNSVIALDDGLHFRHMVQSFTEADSPEDDFPRASYDEVEYAFDAPVMVVPCLPHCAVITGGYLGWYDGHKTAELGFAAPPIIDNVDVTDSGGAVPDGTHQLTTTWEKQDNAGNLHRGVPSPPFEIETAGDPDPDESKYEVHARSLPCTRHELTDMSVQFFRSSADAVFKRRNKAQEMTPNVPDNAFVGDFEDVGDLEADVPLYTTGGVLEAVTPEGAQIAHVGNDRLWSGDFFRQARLQFSHVLAPGSVGAIRLAPEQVEVLGRIIASGERVRGITTLRDVTIVLSERNIFLIGGQGPDRRGVGDDMSRMTGVPVDFGCVDPRSVVVYPDGVLYRSRRCIYQINEGYQIVPLGEAAKDLTTAYPNITSAVVVPEEQQVRFTLDDGETGIVLVYDYRIGEWFEWVIRTADDEQIRPISGAYVSRPDGTGTYYVLRDDGIVWQEDKTTHFDDGDGWVPLLLRMGFVQPTGPAAWHQLYAFTLVANRVDHHGLMVRLYVDYSDTAADAWPLTSGDIQALAAAGELEEITYRPKYGRKARGYSVELEDSPGTDTTLSVTGAGYEIAAVGMLIGIRGGYPKSHHKGRV